MKPVWYESQVSEFVQLPKPSIVYGDRKKGAKTMELTLALFVKWGIEISRIFDFIWIRKM